MISFAYRIFMDFDEQKHGSDANSG